MGRFLNWARRLARPAGDPATLRWHWPRDARPLRVLLAPDLADEYAGAITVAADYWQRAAGETLWQIDVADSPALPALHGIPVEGITGAHYSPGPARGNDPARVWPTFYDNPARHLYYLEMEIPAGLGRKDAERMLGHELGHTLGFGHSTIPGALMGIVHDVAAWDLHPSEVRAARACARG